MAIICFAAASLVVFTAVFPIDASDEDFRRNMVGAAITLSAGIAYWVLARHFRVWMVHAIVVIGFGWGILGLCRAESSIGAALTLTSLLWTGVFVGAAFPPRISRIYIVYVCAGMVLAMVVNHVQGGVAIGLAFGGSFIVTMEILSRATSQLRHEATTDALTGLLNRTGLEREVARVRSFGRDEEPIAILVADLDDFKRVNDQGGHLAGDRLLREFASAWRDGARTGDLVGRIGGDEFVVVFPAGGEEAARSTVERLREIAPVPWSGGLAISEPGESLESCMARADRILYEEKEAKAAGGTAGIRPAPALDDDPGVIAAE